MKNFLFLVLAGLIISCSAPQRSASTINKNEIYLTRKYIGNFVEFRHTGPDIIPGTDLIWIKTSLDQSFGRISAYGKECDFSEGDRLYLKSTNSTAGNIGMFGYIIENDSSVCYRISEYRYENKMFVRAWSQ